MDYSLWGQKVESTQKFMQVMHAHEKWWVWFFWFGDFAPFSFPSNLAKFFSNHGLEFMGDKK